MRFITLILTLLAVLIPSIAPGAVAPRSKEELAAAGRPSETSHSLHGTGARGRGLGIGRADRVGAGGGAGLNRLDRFRCQAKADAQDRRWAASSRSIAERLAGEFLGGIAFEEWDQWDQWDQWDGWDH